MEKGENEKGRERTDVGKKQKEWKRKTRRSENEGRKKGIKTVRR